MFAIDIIAKTEEKNIMKRKYSRVIKEIANREGVSPDVVYAEMQKAIDFGYNNQDPNVQAYWNEIAPDGETPTPEKVIEVLSKKAKRNK